MRYSSHAFLTKQVAALKEKRNELQKELKKLQKELNRESSRANKAELVLQKKDEEINKLKLLPNPLDNTVTKLSEELKKAKEIIKEYKSQKAINKSLPKRVKKDTKKLTTYNANYWKARYFEELKRKTR